MSPRDNTFEQILARLQTLESYTVPRTGVASERHLIGLDTNENYFADTDLIRRIAEEAARCDLRTYPREELVELREMLGTWLHTDPQCIVLANGGDQLIDMTATILQKGGSAVIAWPTYSLYRPRINIAGGRLTQIPLRKDFMLDVSRLVNAADSSQASIIFLCSPNNPTANQFSDTDVIELLTRYPGLVVLDEAYVEFAEHSLAPMVQEHANLAVIRTFSKAFGIAGARLGYMIADPRLSGAFTEKLQLPYPVNKFSARLGIGCLQNVNAMKASVSRMKQERRWLIERLREVQGLRVFDSETNFILVSTNRDSARVSSRLRSLGVSVKDVGDVLDFRGCLRITVGTRTMNERFLSALEQVMSDECL